jgi:hypothetical protein
LNVAEQKRPAVHYNIAGADILREEVVGVDSRHAFTQRDLAMLN